MTNKVNYVLTDAQKAQLNLKIQEGNVVGNYGSAYEYLESTVPMFNSGPFVANESEMSTSEYFGLKTWLNVAQSTNTNNGDIKSLS